jgi:hypothetical protein
LGAPEPTRRRGWWIAAVLVAGVAVFALTRQSHTPPPRHHARPAPTVTDPACRTLGGCVVHAGPAAIARLTRAYLPLHAHLRVRTVLGASPLTQENLFVAREIEAHVDSVTVLIRVQRGGSRTQAIAPDPPGVGSLLLHRITSGFVVRLQYLAPDTVPPMLDRLRALMGDPRLTSG